MLKIYIFKYVSYEWNYILLDTENYGTVIDMQFIYARLGGCSNRTVVEEKL